MRVSQGSLSRLCGGVFRCLPRTPWTRVGTKGPHVPTHEELTIRSVLSSAMDLTQGGPGWRNNRQLFSS